MRIHFIGIGGIGMSGLAELALASGHQVTGSDIVESGIVKRLRSKGVSFFLGHAEAHVEDADMVVYTAAVDRSNPEMVRARQMGLLVLSRAEMLGQLLDKFPHSVAVAGSHGKTTVTSMITCILEQAGFEPTALVGGEMGKSQSNVRIGGQDYLVTEACEYEGSFLYLRPQVGVILNVDLDHVDCYRDFASICRAFERFSRLIRPGGCLVVNADDPEALRIGKSLERRVIAYGTGRDCHWQCTQVEFDGAYPLFRVKKDREHLGQWRLGVPGQHNIDNALAAAATCSFMGVDTDTIKEALEGFTGTLRRFEFKGDFAGVTIVDDYAHHPVEVLATLKAARRLSEGSVWCIFQPHTFSRTKALLKEFAEALEHADVVVISDIYPARETDTGEVSSQDLVTVLKDNGCKVVYGPSFEAITVTVSEEAKPGDVVVTMGAGDIYKVGDMLLNRSLTA